MTQTSPSKPDILVTDSTLAATPVTAPPRRKPRWWVLVSAGAAGLSGLGLAAMLVLGGDSDEAVKLCDAAVAKAAVEHIEAVNVYSRTVRLSFISGKLGEPQSHGDGVDIPATVQYAITGRSGGTSVTTTESYLCQVRDGRATVLEESS